MHSSPIVLAGILLSLPTSPHASAQELRSTRVAQGLAAPICARSAPGDVRRLFVLERAGRIRIVRDGVLLPTPFLDIVAEVSTAGEGGLLGLAFHPEHAHNGRFFVSFSDNSPAALPRVREYRVSLDPDVADASVVVDVLGPIPHADPVHYASDLHFGLDRRLYYSLGHAAQNAPQDLRSYDGKMLRLDVDRPAPHVPLDNPFAAPDDGALDLIWALGLRNPYRFSIDRLTGDLYIGDVGRNDREEINFQPASVGSPDAAGYAGGWNYGWQCMEGTLCTPSTDCACDPTGATLRLPVHEFGHTGATAVIGGHVYRGSAIPGLQGRYFFGEFVSGRVWSLRVSNGIAIDLVDHTADLRGVPANPSFALLTSFGEDANGEIHVTCLASGDVYRIDPVGAPCPAPTSECSSAPTSVSLGAVIGSTGTSSIAAAELVLTARHGPPDSAGVFFHGSTAASVPFGNSLRCAGGGLLRTAVLRCDALGHARQPFEFAAFPLTPGITRVFQFYFRDPQAGGAFFNLSDARRVVFCP